MYLPLLKVGVSLTHDLVCTGVVLGEVVIAMTRAPTSFRCLLSAEPDQDGGNEKDANHDGELQISDDQRGGG